MNNAQNNDHRSGTTPILQINDLQKNYSLGSSNLSVLNGLNLEIARGEMVAIMGPSGSGKTTLLNCISGIDTPNDGVVTVDGNPVDLASENARTKLRRYDIGIVFQFFNLIPTLTVQENVGLPFLISKNDSADNTSKIQKMLDSVGLTERSEHYPSQLSGGEMQLTSIARALVHQPKLILADEPTGNVNPTVGRSIMKILRRTAKQQNTGVLMVTHSPEHAAWADRICFLKGGVIIDQIVQHGNQDDISPIYDKLIELEI